MIPSRNLAVRPKEIHKPYQHWLGVRSFGCLLGGTVSRCAGRCDLIARERACEYIEEACNLLSELDQKAPTFNYLKDLMSQAEKEFQMGTIIESEKGPASSHWAKPTRAFTRAQVRALQVIQALEPVPDKPEYFSL